MKPYTRNGTPIHRPERLNDSVFSIVSQYQDEYRGLVNYYRMDYNLIQLDELPYVMETSSRKDRWSYVRRWSRSPCDPASPGSTSSGTHSNMNQ